MRAAYDDSPITAGKKNLRAVVETPQKPRSTTTDDTSHMQLNPSLPHEQPEAAEDAKEEPTGEEEEDDEMQGEPADTKEAPGTSSSSRGEKRIETQENVPAKKRLMMKSPKRLATPASPSDDPVKRRLLKKKHTCRAVSGNQRHGSDAHDEHTSE